MRVAVTGMGIVSSLGLGLEKNRDALIHGRSGIGKSQFLECSLKASHVFGEVPFSNQELAHKANRSFHPVAGRGFFLAALALQEALDSLPDREKARETALICGTSVGGMDTTERFYAAWKESGSLEGIDALLFHECGSLSSRLAALLPNCSYVNTVSTACSSSANSLMQGAQMIRAGQARRVIAGGVDPLSAFTANGFNSLMILDAEWCRPFSAERRGLNLGEAAAFLVLEDEALAKERGASILAYLSGYGNSNDSFHQTASSAEGIGAQLAMKKALQTAGLNPDDIDCINAHGTGTQNNDASESAAIAAIFGDRVPPLSSTKAHTGHTLGAAGAVEAVFSVLSLQEQMAFCTLNMGIPMPGNTWQALAVNKAMPIHHILSNSFGFGGNTSSLLFSGHVF